MRKRVFISYSHESAAHKKRVGEFAKCLKIDGFDVRFDQFENAKTRLPKWMREQMDEADFVIVVCTALYKEHFEGRSAGEAGKGVAWEGLLVENDIYENKGNSEKYIPVFFEGAPSAVIPKALSGNPRYALLKEYDGLIGHINRDAIARERERLVAFEERLQQARDSKIIQVGAETVISALLDTLSLSKGGMREKLNRNLWR